jgi:catechol 2,3-dioxygenase-like lactoylglutathione lyase family enzyme
MPTARSAACAARTRSCQTTGRSGLEAHKLVRQARPMDEQTARMLRLGTVVMGASDVPRAVSFWSNVLGYRPITFEGAEDGFVLLVPPSGEGTRVAVHRSDVEAQDRPRIHIDLVVDDDREQIAEVERLMALGAAKVSWEYPSDPDFIVLSDTEGNRFCVVDASH